MRPRSARYARHSPCAILDNHECPELHLAGGPIRAKTDYF